MKKGERPARYLEFSFPDNEPDKFKQMVENFINKKLSVSK